MCGTEGCGSYRYWPTPSYRVCQGRHCAHDAECYPRFGVHVPFYAIPPVYHNPNPFTYTVSGA